MQTLKSFKVKQTFSWSDILTVSNSNWYMILLQTSTFFNNPLTRMYIILHIFLSFSKRPWQNDVWTECWRGSYTSLLSGPFSLYPFQQPLRFPSLFLEWGTSVFFWSSGLEERSNVMLLHKQQYRHCLNGIIPKKELSLTFITNVNIWD